MVFNGRHPITADFEDTVYACRNCGAELIRTSLRKAAGPGDDRTPAAAA